MRPTPILRLHAPRAALFAAALVAATVATGVAARPVSADPSTAVVTDFSSPVGSPTNAAGFFIDLFFSQGVTGLTTSDFSFTQGACTMGLRPMGPAWYQVVLSSCADGTTVVRLASLSVVSAFDGSLAPVSAVSSTAVVVDRTAPASSVSVTALGTGPAAGYAVDVAVVASDATSGVVSSAVQYSSSSDMANPTLCAAVDAGGGTASCTLPAVAGTYWMGSAAHDWAGNVETLTADDSVVVDATPPTATVTAPGEWTTAQPVPFSVSYSEPVFGLSPADFTLSGGCTAAAITGSGPYVLSLSGCPDGTISVTHKLAAVTDIGGNTGPALAIAHTTTLDTTAPSSTGTIAPDLTAASSVAVAYTASDATSGLGKVSAYRTPVDAPPAPTLCGTVVSSSPSGTVPCSLVDGAWYVYTRATDKAGNVEAAPQIADDKITRDATAPTVVITPDATHTNGAPTYGLVFSEDVTGLAATDFAPFPATCHVTTPIGSGTAWSVSLTGCPEGEVDLALTALSVADGVGNQGPPSAAFSVPVFVDRTAPTVSSIVLAAASDTGRLHDDRLTTTTSPVFTMTFSEALDTGPSAGAISFTGSGAGLCVAGTPTGSGAAWSVPVTGCGQGAVVLHYEGSTVLDLAGNTDPTTDSTSARVTIDTTPPTLTLAALTSSPTNVPDVALGVAGNEPLDCSTMSGTPGVDFTFTNVASTQAPITGANACLLPVTSSIAAGAAGQTTIATAPSFSISDDAGNAATSATGSPASVTVDRARPTATLVPTVVASTSSAVTYTLTFGEPVTAPALAAFQVGGTALECTVAAVDRTGDATFTVSVACSSDGSVTLRLLADAVTDASANPGPAAPVDAAVFTIDTLPPSVSGIAIAPRAGAPLAGTAIPVTVTWTASDAGGSGIASSTVDVSMDGGATWAPAAGTPTLTTLVTTLPFTGTVTFRVAVADRAGNVTPGLFSGPRMASLVQQGARAVTYKGSWTTAKSSRYSAGSAKYAKAKGASASYTFTGRSIALVSATASTRGKAKIYVNGVLVKTVDLRAATRYRSVVWAKTWSSTVTKTVKVVVVGTSGRPRVDVDAFVVIR